MRSVIRFLNARNMKPADIRQLCDMYGEHAMSDSIIGDRWDTLMKDAKICMMICGVADRLDQHKMKQATWHA
jgi:hypothetical protein